MKRRMMAIFQPAHIPAEAGSGMEQSRRCPQWCQWCQPCHQADGNYRWHLLSVSWALTEGAAEEEGWRTDRPSGATPCSPPPVSRPIWQLQALPSGWHQVEAGFRRVRVVRPGLSGGGGGGARFRCRTHFCSVSVRRANTVSFTELWGKTNIAFK